MKDTSERILHKSLNITATIAIVHSFERALKTDLLGILAVYAMLY